MPVPDTHSRAASNAAIFFQRSSMLCRVVDWTIITLAELNARMSPNPKRSERIITWGCAPQCWQTGLVLSGNRLRDSTVATVQPRSSRYLRLRSCGVIFRGPQFWKVHLGCDIRRVLCALNVGRPHERSKVVYPLLPGTPL